MNQMTSHQMDQTKQNKRQSNATWVFCCGMKRSGSTLQYQITKEIVESAGVGKAIGGVYRSTFNDVYDKYAEDDGLLVVKCHDYFSDMQRLSDAQKVKAIYSYRDIRDVIVSMLNATDQSFWHLMRAGFVERMLNNYQHWTTMQDVMVTQYENMVADVPAEVSKIARFLEISLDEQTSKDIAERYELKRQKERIEKGNFPVTETGRIKPDPQSLLLHRHINSGASEQWRHALTAMQIGLIEDIAEQWMIAHKYVPQSSIIDRKRGQAILGLFKIWCRLNPKARA